MSGDTIYVGGQFTSVEGEPRNHLTAIGIDGTLRDWSPVAGDTVYLGGEFLSVGEQARERLAAVGIDGTLRDWSPAAGGWAVYALALASDTVYVGGNISRIDGQKRYGMEAIGTDGTLRDWNPSAGSNSSLLPVGTTYDLVTTDDTLLASGIFRHIGEKWSPISPPYRWRQTKTTKA